MDSKHTCVVCGSNFSNRSNLRQHERFHIGDTKYTCCERGFASQANLQRHRCSVHGETKSHVCTTCNKGFSTNADLRRHERRERTELAAVGHMRESSRVQI